MRFNQFDQATMRAAEVDNVPCKWCLSPTRMVKTRLCDKCWDLEHRIAGNLSLARRMVRSLTREENAMQRISIGGADGGESIDVPPVPELPRPVFTIEHRPEIRGPHKWEVMYGKSHYGLYPDEEAAKASVALAKESGL